MLMGLKFIYKQLIWSSCLCGFRDLSLYIYIKLFSSTPLILHILENDFVF